MPGWAARYVALKARAVTRQYPRRDSCCCADAPYLVSGDGGGMLKVWHERTGEQVTQVQAHTAQVSAMCAVGSMVYTASR